MDLQYVRRSTRSGTRWLLAVFLCWALLGVSKADAQAPVPPTDDPTVAWLKNCDAGTVADCRKLGNAYSIGNGKSRNRVIAALLFDEACAGGDFEGCFRSGAQYKGGGGVKTDHARAANLYRKGCDGGFLEACIGLSNLYFRGDGVPKDQARAEMLLSDACGRGEGKACDELARRYIGGFGVDRQKARGIALYEQSCKASAASSCRALGDLYRNGQDAVPDPEQSAAFSAKACQFGDAESCFDEAEIYRRVDGRSDGIPLDAPRAALSLGRACDLGSAAGCDALGKMLFAGTEIAPDRARATGLFDRACSLDENKCENYRLIKEEAGLDTGCSGGSRDDCVTLGSLYAYRDAPGFSPGLSDKAFFKACDLGDAGSCRYLGEVYRDGREAAQDKKLAATLFGKACDLSTGVNHFLMCSGVVHATQTSSGGMSMTRSNTRSSLGSGCSSEVRAFMAVP